MNLLIPLNTPKDAKVINCYESYKKSEKVLHRYDISVGSYEGEGVRVRIYHRTFPVIRETAASYIIDHYDQSKAVLKGDGKRFAHDSEEKALYSLRKRTSWRQSHAHWALTSAHAVIDAFNETFGSQFPKLKPLTKASMEL